MLEYDRIDISEGTDTNKTNCSHECIICHYWYFLRLSFRFQSEVSNGCHDMTQKSISFNDVVITTGGNDYKIFLCHD